MPRGPTHDRVEALLLGVRSAKMCLKAAAAKSQFFAECLTIGKLVDKLGKIMQNRWYRYRAVHIEQPEGVSFEAWLIQEGKAAVKQRQCTLAAKYQTTQGTEPAQADSAHKYRRNRGTGSVALDRDKPIAPGMMEAHSFGIEPSADQLKCPVRGSQHAYTGNDGLIKLPTALINCEIWC